MTKPVTIVIPALDDRALLAAHLPAVLAELRARNVGDEVVVVDDTGSGVLEPWLTQQFPPPATFDAASVDVRCVVRAENGGYAAAARSGVEAAAHDLVYLLNPDVRVEPGFLAPLVAAMEDTHVVAAVGRTVLCGDPSHVETLLVPQWRNGRLVMREHGTRPEDASHEPAEAAFALGWCGVPSSCVNDTIRCTPPFIWKTWTKVWSGARKAGALPIVLTVVLRTIIAAALDRACLLLGCACGSSATCWCALGSTPMRICWMSTSKPWKSVCWMRCSTVTAPR